MPRPRLGHERREEILSAFERCVIRKGLLKTTLTDVAGEAGQPRSLVRYFIGNRADMVDALIERLVNKGEAQLELVQDAGAYTTEKLIEHLFDVTFADTSTNLIIIELVYLATKDEELKGRLVPLYQRMIDELAAQMAREKLGATKAQRQSVAYAIISLAYGAETFSHLGLLKTLGPDPRPAAHALLATLRS